MKSILASSLSLLITVYSIGATQADENKASNYLDSHLTADLLDVSYISRQPVSNNDTGKDTIAEQTKVLEKINNALARGAITPDQTSDLKEQLNSVGASESWYKSIAVPVPETVVKANTEKLAVLNREIDKQLPLQLSKATMSSSATSYSDVSKLIGHAAASNKITNAQAQEYYTQLAQIQNDAESLKNDPSASNSEKSRLIENLHSLKSDVQKRLK